MTYLVELSINLASKNDDIIAECIEIMMGLMDRLSKFKIGLKNRLINDNEYQCFLVKHTTLSLILLE